MKLSVQVRKVPCKYSSGYWIYEETAKISEPYQMFGAPKSTVSTFKGAFPITSEMSVKFSNNEPVEVVICESGIKQQLIVEKLVPTINVIPETILGSLTVGIGAIGTIIAVLPNSGVPVAATVSFIVAGLGIIIGSRLLKKRAENV